MINVSEIESKWQFLKDKTLYIACSGGVDSITLLHVFAQLNYKVHVLHVNYQLRGTDSTADEEFVCKTCEKLQVPIEIRRVDTSQILRESGGNLQDVARKIRYDWFHEVLEESDAAYVLLAHHADDQVETFFQHIARKSGIIGMAGMLAQNGRIIRPFLHLEKSEILRFAVNNRIFWREDASNLKSDYTRNKLRNLILPGVESHIPALKASVLLLVDAFQETQRQLEHDVKPYVELLQSTGMLTHVQYDSLSEFQLAELLRTLSIRQSAVASIRQLRNAQKGKKISCDGYQIVQEKDAFEFIKSETSIAYTLKIDSVEKLPTLFSKDVLYLDADQIRGELILRKWKIGDRISPVGMKGSKLISDVLAESKLKSSERKHALVLTDEEDVLWCVGMKISRKCTVSASSKKLVRVQVIPTSK